jgi:hypothetical protein
MKLIPIKYRVDQDIKPGAYFYIERAMNNKECWVWYIAVPGEKGIFNFHVATFTKHKNGFESPEQALEELEKYLKATL